MFDKNLHCHKKQEFYPKPVLLLSKSAKTGKQKVLQGKMDKNSITTVYNPCSDSLESQREEKKNNGCMFLHLIVSLSMIMCTEIETTQNKY